MRRFTLSPLIRISFGLVMLTVSLLLISEFLGMVPNKNSAVLESRKAIAESLAVQLSAAISNNELYTVKETLRAIVDRNESVLSAAIRIGQNDLLYKFGDHKTHWSLDVSDHSTARQIQVAIYGNQGRWGNMELRFTEIGDNTGSIPFKQSYLALVMFVAILGFISYMLFLKRVVHELNTDNIIPDRVRRALDSLTESLLIVDHAGYIVFSNSAFSQMTGLTADEAIGTNTSECNWQLESVEAEAQQLPWESVLAGGTDVLQGELIQLKTKHNKTVHLTVNASPIMSPDEKIQGALITFDDVSEIEAKNEELLRTLTKLEQAQAEVTEQNQQLQILATRDPMTNALNRRSLFEGLDALFAEASEQQEPLSFIMVDIDHFKAVNDTYGHATGDRVIVFLANCLTKHARPQDLVARFGGEEFCVVTPGTNINDAALLAEKMRFEVQHGHGGDYEEELNITASLGVATLATTVNDSNGLFELADQALYKAKEGGRNQVVCWTEGVEENPVSAPKPATVRRTSIVSVDEPSAKTNPQTELSDSSVTHKNILLFNRIDQAITRSSYCDTNLAVLVMDIDILQRVNDTLGLLVGEKFVSAITKRLKNVIRDTDTLFVDDNSEFLFSISPLGSREIVLLLTDLDKIDSVVIVLKRIFHTQDEPIVLEGNEYYLSSNIGISAYPTDGDTSATLIKNASIAKREAMRLPGENNYFFYTDEISQLSKDNILLETDLYSALKQDELIIFYQPKVDLKTGNIVGFEALLRWQHPQRGLIPPDAFISIAERTGLIGEISQWVIRTVCNQILLWHDAGFHDISVSINLSPVEFGDPDLASKIIASVAESHIPPKALEIEITETIALHNMNTAVDMLAQISLAGIGISVDDFGTGYASLSYLQRLPISKIKIDRSFITGILVDTNDAVIVSGIIAMGHTLGLDVIAEGIETEEQLRFLQDLHCDQIQGYLISRPVPRDTIDELLANSEAVKNLILHKNIDANRNMSDDTNSMINILNNLPNY